MSLIKTEKLEKNRVELQIGIDRAALDAEIRKVYAKEIKNMSIPGFRKGKAPLAMVQKMYGKGIFVDDALNNLLPDAYEAAVKEAGLAVVSRPEFDIVSMEDGKDVVLKALVDVKPEVTLKAYKGLKAEKDAIVVTDDMVEADVKAAQQRAAREVEVTDRASEMGDTADIDFEGFVDGVPFEGGKGEHHKLKLGSGQFIPGFEEQVAGKNIGDEFDVNVTFPTEYGAENLAGKAAVFKCKLHGITKEELPELDDEFAKDMSFDTLDAYKADVRAKITERMEKTADQIIENRILDALLENMEAEIPESMYANEVENQLREYDMQLRSNGLDLNTYFKYTGQTLDQLRENFRPRAERSVKVRLALEAVVKAEGISATEEEVNAEYDRMAAMYSMEVEKVKEAVASEDLAADLNVQNALKLVKDSAVVTEKAAETEAKPKAAAKKTTAKAKAEKTEGEEAPAKPKTTRTRKTAAEKADKAE